MIGYGGDGEAGGRLTPGSLLQKQVTRDSTEMTGFS